MDNRKFKLIFVSIWFVLAAVLAGGYIFSSHPVSGQRLVSDMAKEIEGYRNWTRVNKVPRLMPKNVAKDCAAPRVTPDGRRVDGEDNPHVDKYFTVYVNDIGKKAMLGQLKPLFPEGSVIVKEKLSDQKSQVPELMTVMIKQKKGFDPAGGDWEYMVTDGTGTRVDGRGKLANCQACHIVQAQSDYVFRSYLDAGTWEKLK